MVDVCGGIVLDPDRICDLVEESRLLLIDILAEFAIDIIMLGRKERGTVIRSMRVSRRFFWRVSIQFIEIALRRPTALGLALLYKLYFAFESAHEDHLPDVAKSVCISSYLHYDI